MNTRHSSVPTVVLALGLAASASATAWLCWSAEPAARPALYSLAGLLMLTSAISAALVRQTLIGAIRRACFASQAVMQGRMAESDSRSGSFESERLLDRILDGLRAQKSMADAGASFEGGLRCHPAPTCVLDREGRIVFVNRALQAQIAPGRDLPVGAAPATDLDRLLGKGVLSLLGTPERVSRGPVSPKAEHRTRIETAGQVFEVTTRPVLNDAGEHLGWTSHWVNAVSARELEARLRARIESVERGDFKSRIDRNGLGVEQQSLALLVNDLLDRFSNSFAQLREIVDNCSESTQRRNVPSFTEFIEQLTRFCESAAMNRLVRQALDSASVPMRIVDVDGKILFLSKPLQRKVASLEPEIRRRIPGFDKDKLIGGSIGIFYPNPGEALARLRGLTAERRSRLEIGGRDFDIVTNPIRNEAGELIGSVGEWVDRHEELQAEKRLGELISAASHGEFGGRIDLLGLAGFHLDAARGINDMMDQVSASLRELAEVLKAMSEGDLSREMRGSYQGVFRQLQGTVNDTIHTMAQTIGQIRSTADSVSQAAREISRGNADLSERTEQQATSLELTSSKMRELIALVTSTAEHSQDANRLAAEASNLASTGGTTVSRVVQTMSEIGEASRRVEEIIAVINGISFQTNILALNAAVEAARAGEQGRGFAVVATEVRTLAKRSSEAAREIRELITTATQRVDSGALLVGEAGTQMTEIVSAIKRTTDVIAEIASAAATQHQGIQQIGEEVRNMDEMTQRNSALVEEASAAAEQLDTQSARMADSMAAFRLGAPPAQNIRGTDSARAGQSRHLMPA